MPPYRVLVPSGNDVGKSWLAAAAANFWYDTRDPGAVFVIGPRRDSIKDTIFGVMRVQREKAGLPNHFIGPSAPEMRSSPMHWCKAMTASKGASLTGRHLRDMFFLLEEAIGVESVYWDVLNTMFDPELGHAMLAIFNPTDTTSRAYLEDRRCDDTDGEPRWHRFRLSALNHPNVLNQLRGGQKLIEGAVSLGMVEGWIADDCDVVSVTDRQATDLEWPPSEITGQPGRWYRPNPIFQAKAMGLWPDTGDSIWSELLFQGCCRFAPDFNLRVLPQVGCDTSTGKGDDYMAICGRWGAVAVCHETSNTMKADRIFARLKEVCHHLAGLYNQHLPASAQPITPRQIAVKIDDDGTGGAVCSLLQADGYQATAVGAGTVASDPERYPSKRSELWFQTAEKARLGLVNLSRLDQASQRRLKQQLMAPTWKVDAAGRRVVEKKDDTKEKIGRSPDDADALNLSWYEAPNLSPSTHTPTPSTEPRKHRFAR